MTSTAQIIAAALQLLVALSAFLTALGFIPAMAELNAALIAALAAINGTGSAMQSRNGH